MIPAPAARPAASTAIARPGAGIDATSLALVLVLVAFFALIAAKADRSAEREAAVLASVSASFAGAASDPAAVRSDPAWAALVESLQQVVGTAGTVQALAGGGDLRIALPSEAVFLGDGASPDPRGGALLDGVAAVLVRDAAGAGTAVTAASADVGLAARRAARLAYELAARGLDPALLSVGAHAGSGLVIAVRWAGPA